MKNQNQQKKNEDAFNTSVIHTEEKPKQDDIFSTSVIHSESPPAPRKLSRRGSSAPKPKPNDPSPNSTLNNITTTLAPGDIQKIMEQTMKAIQESQTKILRELAEVKSEIVSNIEGANQLTIIIEGKGDKIHETNEALREYVRSHIHEVDQGTLLKIVNLIKKKT